MEISKYIFSTKSFLALLAGVVIGLLVLNLLVVLKLTSPVQPQLLSFSEDAKNFENSALIDKSVETNLSPFPPSSLPHPNCAMELNLGHENSNVYNPDTPYNLSFFMGNQSGFQDVNGDGLADYVYVNTTYGGTHPQSVYTGCVYLNNGSGWTKVHTCRANTIIDASTGQITTAEYRGDCAGE
ncbi:MAG TPA: hypothetical protein PKD79_01560, partial [Candidatus Doudnabacteria bacterium]|nr:hypothetical protein [Candidatus Doudnabacteria bacterium]